MNQDIYKNKLRSHSSATTDAIIKENFTGFEEISKPVETRLDATKVDSPILIEIETEAIPKTRPILITETIMAQIDFTKKKQISKLIETIPTFSGKRDYYLEENLNIFLKKCKHILEMLDVEEQKYFMSIIDIQFRGDALILVNSETFETFKQMQDFLYAYYIPRKEPSDILREIDNIFQKPNETILGYRERLEALVGKYKSLVEQQHQSKAIADSYLKDVVQQAIRAFKYGLRDKAIQTALFHENDETLETVAESALKWEKVERLRNQSMKYDSNNEENSRTNQLLETLVEKLDKTHIQGSSKIEEQSKDSSQSNLDRSKTEILLEKLLQKLDTANGGDKKAKFNESNGVTSNNFCEFCHRHGHKISECRTKINTPFCNYCHRYSHTIEDCPRKNYRQDRSYRNNQGRNNSFTPNQSNPQYTPEQTYYPQQQRYRSEPNRYKSPQPQYIQRQQASQSYNNHNYRQSQRYNYGGQRFYPRENNYQSNIENGDRNHQNKNGQHTGIRLLQQSGLDNYESQTFNGEFQGNDVGADCNPQSANPTQ